MGKNHTFSCKCPPGASGSFMSQFAIWRVCIFLYAVSALWHERFGFLLLVWHSSNLYSSRVAQIALASPVDRNKNHNSVNVVFYSEFIHMR